MATVTLAQAAQLEKQPLKKGIMMGISQYSVIADILTFRSIGGLAETGVRYDEVIEPDWIPLDGTISSKSANGKPLTFSVYEASLHIDVPAMLENQSADMLERQSVRQTMLATKGFAYTLNDAFINGDQGVNANQPEGLRKMLNDLASTQVVGAAELDISATATSTTNMLVVERILDTMTFVEGSKPDAAFCNRTFARQFRKIILREKLLGDTHDWINSTYNTIDPRLTQRTASTRPDFVFDGVPFYIIGTKADQSTEIIGNTYTEGGSSAAATRVFMVKFDDENIEGIQAAPLEVLDIGMLQDKNNIRKRLTWRPGFANWGPRSIAMAAGIKVA